MSPGSTAAGRADRRHAASLGAHARAGRGTTRLGRAPRPAWTALLLAPLLLGGACRARYEPRHPGPVDFAGRVLQRFDFESGEPGPWTELKLPGPDALALIPDPANPRDRVARFTLHRDDPQVSDGRRAELQLEEVGDIGSGRDWWYGFRTHLPAGWARDPAYEVLAQWKGKRDKELGEASKSPALALRSRGEELYITSRWDARAVTPDNRAPEETLWRGALEPGTWTTWVFHVRWSYRDDGLLRIWKDGRQIVEKRGPNTYRDRRGMYFKIGIYKPPWDDPERPSRVERRVVLHDDVWIGTGE